MDLYKISLFVHILALFAAGVATGITKLAAGRKARAQTVNEVLEWHKVLTSAAKIFPMALLAFVVTGIAMMIIGHVRPSSSPFIVAGLLGSAAMMVNGIYLGTKGRGLQQMLERLVAQNANQLPPRVSPPFYVTIAPTMNTGLGIAIALVMVIKPQNLVLAIGIVAAGAILGAVFAERRTGATAVHTHAPSPALARQSPEVQQ